MSQAYFLRSIRFYSDARARLRTRFQALSAQWPVTSGPGQHRRDVLFVGTGEVAEVAYVCLHETDLQLVGVVDFLGRERFFGVEVHSAGAIGPEVRSRWSVDCPVAIAFNDSDAVRAFLNEAGIPPERVFWI